MGQYSGRGRGHTVTIEEVVRARLLTVVGGIVGNRVYLDKLPQGVTYPAVRVTLIDDQVDYHLRGPVGAKSARVQVDAYAAEASGLDVYDQVTGIADAIEGDGLGTSATGLSGWVGVLGSPPFYVEGGFRVSRTRWYDPQELRVLTMSQDFIVWYRG